VAQWNKKYPTAVSRPVTIDPWARPWVQWNDKCPTAVSRAVDSGPGTGLCPAAVSNPVTDRPGTGHGLALGPVERKAPSGSFKTRNR